MTTRAQSVEIFAPVVGLKYDAPTTMLDVRAMADGTNTKCYYGALRKPYGSTLFSTGTLPSAVTFLYNAEFPSGASIQAFTDTGVHRHSSTTDSFVVDGQTFTGTYSDYWAGIMHNDTFVYTNGLDPIQVKTSVSATGTNMASALSPDTYKAYALASFREHLCLYRTEENGTEYYKRVRWTKKGVLSYSAGTTDFGSGTYGAEDLMDAQGEIKAVAPLGIAMAIYANRSIHVQTWQGGAQVYKFTKTVDGLGTPSRRGVISHGDVNYFIGEDSFYAYYGGDDYRDIGAPIKKEAFNTVNQGELKNAFAEYDWHENEVLFHIPTGTATLPDKTWVYRLDNKSWNCLDTPADIRSKGDATRFSATTIGDLQGTIGDQTGVIGDYFIAQGAVTQLYGLASGYIAKKDRSVNSVIASGTSTAQTYTYVTADIVGLGPQGGKISDPYDDDEVDYTTRKKRYLRFTFEAAGNGEAAISYSPDKGVSWIAFDESPVTLSPSGTNHELDLDYTSRQMRFRIVNTGQNNPIAVTYAKVEMTPTSTR